MVPQINDQPMLLKKFLQKNRLREGDKIKATYYSNALEGIITPSPLKDTLVLKLNSGYNIGIRPSRIEKIEKVASTRGVSKAEKTIAKKNQFLPTVSILQIGGTIAARVDYKSGAVFSSFEPADLISMFPDLSELANLESRLISNMFSEDMGFAHYKKIAKEIEKEMKKDIAGIILPHGTDTMHYSAAALSFMIENPKIPIILVGSQRSTDRGSSDAAMNLISAMEFITKTDFAGIGICMHESMNDDYCVILPACKTRKLHTSRRDAFKPVNDTPIARINYKAREIEFIKKDHQKRNSSGRTVFRPNIDERVALIKTHPNIKAGLFDYFRKTRIRGLVIEGTGLGQLPIGTPNELCIENPEIKKSLEKLIKSGCIVVMTSQCIFGRMQMHVYDNAVELVKMGVIPSEDMLAETAFIKLAWLLGNYKNKWEVRKLMQENLRGEITPFTRINSFNFPAQ